MAGLREDGTAAFAEPSAACYAGTARADITPPVGIYTRMWGAALHEAGMFMTHSGYHKHGAYLLTHTEMPGFSRQEQRFVAALVQGHRGKPTKEKISAVAPMWDRRLLHLVCLLRIASHIHRRRSPRPAPAVRMTAQSRTVQIVFPGDWLVARPLSRADLEDDARLLQGLGYRISIA